MDYNQVPDVKREPTESIYFPLDTTNQVVKDKFLLVIEQFTGKFVCGVFGNQIISIFAQHSAFNEAIDKLWEVLQDLGNTEPEYSVVEADINLSTFRQRCN